MSLLFLNHCQIKINLFGFVCPFLTLIYKGKKTWKQISFYIRDTIVIFLILQIKNFKLNL